MKKKKKLRLILTKPRMWNPPTPKKRCCYNKNHPRSRNTNSINENESNKRKWRFRSELILLANTTQARWWRISHQSIPYSSNKQGRLSVTWLMIYLTYRNIVVALRLMVVFLFIFLGTNWWWLLIHGFPKFALLSCPLTWQHLWWKTMVIHCMHIF